MNKHTNYLLHRNISISLFGCAPICAITAAAAIVINSLSTSTTMLNITLTVVPAAAIMMVATAIAGYIHYRVILLNMTPTPSLTPEPKCPNATTPAGSKSTPTEHLR